MNPKESSLVIEKQLNIHFDTDFTAPKIKAIKDPQTFFNYYTGKKKQRSDIELIKLNSEVSFYYNDRIGEVHFKGFVRNGSKSFKEITGTIHHPISDILHEFIHHWQVKSGGYGIYNLFDEGFCETSTYVITGDIKQYSDYMEYIQILWNVLGIYTDNPIKKYEMVREYNISENKEVWHNECIDDFLNTYSSVASSREDFIKQAEGQKDISKGFEKHCFKQDTQSVINDLYKAHDYYKNNGELLKIFK